MNLDTQISLCLMLTQKFFERFLEIQCQILDNKIEVLKGKLKSIKSDVAKEYRLQSITLERRKNKMIREYRQAKVAKTKSYDQFVQKLNRELQDICTLYNNLYKDLESFK